MKKGKTMEDKNEKRRAIEAKTAEVVEFCKSNKFDAELVGCWVWVSFDEKPDEETRKLLKDAGFRWVRKRSKWAHNCGRPCRSSKSNPWDKYEHKYVSISN